jgi:hypothetical protein
MTDKDKIKQCNCLPNAVPIAREMDNITKFGLHDEDVFYALGMMFIAQESGLADTYPEFTEIVDTWRSKEKMKRENREASLRTIRSKIREAARKIEEAACK